MRSTFPNHPLTRRAAQRLQLIGAMILVLSLFLAACNGEATPAPITTGTAAPTFTPISSPTLTPTPTEPAPFSGSGGGVLAYTSMRNFNWQIFVVNADGSGQAQVPLATRYGYEPTWSPDGTKLVFQCEGLWIADIASGEMVRLPQTAGSDELPNPYLVKPSWSPDGEWIAFINESGFQGDMYLVRPDGTELTRLTDTDDVSRDGNLVWSPDGTRLAYSADRGGNIEIYVMDIAAARQGQDDSRPLTDTPAPVRNLVTDWSPDGAQIAFSSDRDGNTELYLMNPDGGGIVRLTEDPLTDQEPAFSPDGRQIAFSSNREGNFDIYILDLQELGDARQLTDHSGDDTGPVWRPIPGAIFHQMPETIDPGARYVFYLHGRLIEEQGAENPVSPDFGLYEYTGILDALAVNGNQVISEVRPLNTDAAAYAAHIAGQIETLLAAGVPPENITVVGFSKGGAITILVSAQLENSRVNYVVLAGGCSVSTLEEDESIVFHGRVLSIYEAGDEYGQSCRTIADRSPEPLVFEEIRLETGLAHGEFYQLRDEWIIPVLEWIQGN